MHCVFINLDSQIARREALEKNLKERAPEWKVQRQKAFTGADAEAQDIYRVIYNNKEAEHNPGGTGCYLSHMKVIENSLSHDSPVVVLEDDAELGLNSAASLKHIINSLPKDSWDVIFGSVCYVSIPSIIEAFFRMRQALEAKSIFFASAKDVHFACTTTYVVNHSAKQKLLECLQATPINYGFDISMREIFHSGQLRGLIPHPFVTCVSKHSSVGQGTYSGHVDGVLNSFRKLLYAERDFQEIDRDMAATDGYFSDTESDFFGKILAAILSPKFTGK